MDKLLISLFDYTGNSSRPYLKNGWIVVQVDKQLGTDIMNFNPELLLDKLKKSGHTITKIGVIAMIPCDNYATCGSKHFKAKDTDGRTDESQILVERTRYIIDFFDNAGNLEFWQVENPKSRIHKLNPWLGKIRQKFNPCDFAGYDPIPDNSRYNKETWLWGNFNLMTKKYMEPFEKDNPGWKNYGGKSLKTKNARSITPLGFAYAFYEANH